MPKSRLRDADTEAAALRRSPLASLAGGAISDKGRALVSAVMGLVEEFEAKGRRRVNQRRDAGRAKLQTGVGAFLANLLLAHASGSSWGWVSRSLSARSFTDGPVSARTFQSVRAAFHGLKLIETKAGFRRFLDFGSGPTAAKGQVTRFRATPKLVTLSEKAGISGQRTKQHFSEGLPSRPLKLRANSSRDEFGAKVRGQDMDFDHTKRTRQLEAEVVELNEFLDKVRLQGGVHRGYVRIFNNGANPKFKWNMGGRLYSVGEDSYQQLDKRQRLSMKINGEAVCEIDIRASFLTIFLAGQGVEADLKDDPYRLPGIVGDHSRDVIKAFFTATFGNNAHLTKWPREIISNYRERTGGKLNADYPLETIQAEALHKFPALKKWGVAGRGWEHLMYAESVAMIMTMLDLKREDSVPSFAVHDSLIIPRSKAALAKRRLSARYEWVTGGTRPKLVAHPQ